MKGDYVPGSYCIKCGKKKNGIEVADDHVLKTLRWFKANVTKDVKNNTLVVCKECYPKYSKMRKKYVSRRTGYLALGILFLIVSMIIALGAWLTALSFGVGIILLLYLLSLINYTPGLKIKKTAPKKSIKRK